MNRKIVTGLVGLGALALIAWPVYAHCGKCAGSCKAMVAAMDAGKTSLAKAIEAAEAHSKGRAVAAQCDIHDGKVGFHVYCMAGDKLVEVEVDGAGKAMSMEDAKSLPAGAHDDHAAHEGHEGHDHEAKKPGKPGN